MLGGARRCGCKYVNEVEVLGGALFGVQGGALVEVLGGALSGVLGGAGRCTA